MTNAPNPAHILQVGLGFWASKTLLSAVEIDLFTELAEGSQSRAELETKLALHPRSSADFLDTLVALGFLAREGDGDRARYANTPETALFLDRRGPAYVGGLLKMASARLYAVWGSLLEGLRTGRPQNEIAKGGDFFETVYSNPAALEEFLSAMAGISAGPCMALAEKFDFGRYKTLTDAGGASGVLAMCVARRHPHIKATTIDLPPVAPIAKRAIAAAGLAERIEVASGDFFRDPLPRADVITMGHILHDWDLDEKKKLIRAAYDALPEGGAFIAVDTIIDDARRENAFGLLMSLNMLMETPGGFDYTGADFARWCREIGFSRVEVLPLGGPTSAAIAIK
ncbi:MAG TPA: methyltransferase [Nannocystaceae bacterium]|nr:methyltransferase [Nannocystaceae bacterium]